MTISGWRHVYSGKVRDLYIPETESGLDSSPSMLLVASDRVSAFDHVLEPGIPGKGALLTALSRWWFDQLAEFPNHLLSSEPPAEVANRAMVVRT
ncbi:MAG: phosphoribosylaminoimidazolesuccinocarboxamide synthase, partial [Microbacteriaceae bacterium]|nr:phosphoribosylaminoimidazolesuccinocarboxamide synthase [Microbacteriaceae bacterium]